MARESPAQRNLSNALRVLKILQDAGKSIVHTEDLDRTAREALVANGFLRPVIKGWYMPSRPDEEDGDSTAWYANALEFVGRYCTHRFGDAWCLSPDFSIRIQTGNTSLPQQVLVHAPGGQNSLIQLPGNHSILDYRASALPDKQHLTVVLGVRLMTMEYALTRVPQAFFVTYANDAQIALASLKDASGLARILLEGNQPVVAGRLAAGLRSCGRDEMADDIVSTMKRAGHAVSEADPFQTPPTYLHATRAEPPAVTRIRLMWAQMREQVIAAFPPEPGLPEDADAYLKQVRDAYVRDAYNSLSIEGYRVTENLIERVAKGSWRPEINADDRQSRDAMAARGYFLARKSVEDSIRKLHSGNSAGKTIRSDHRAWFRELFAPSVDAKLIKAGDLAGYRETQVYIKNASHVPPSPQAVRDMMPAFFDLLEAEPSAAVRAVLGHFVFVFIHPYMDGNGRMGRFVMNAMLASGGYPWTIIEVAHRSEYMSALDEASSRADVSRFAQFIASSMAIQGNGESPTPSYAIDTPGRRGG